MNNEELYNLLKRCGAGDDLGQSEEPITFNVALVEFSGFIVKLLESSQEEDFDAAPFQNMHLYNIHGDTIQVVFPDFVVPMTKEAFAKKYAHLAARRLIIEMGLYSLREPTFNERVRIDRILGNIYHEHRDSDLEEAIPWISDLRVETLHWVDLFAKRYKMLPEATKL